MLTCVICTIVLSAVLVGNAILQRKIKNSTLVYKAELKDKEKTENTNMDNTNSEDNKTFEENAKSKKEDAIKNNQGTVNLCLMGEIMLGGQVTTNLNYMYMDAFKEIYNIPKSSDFAYANFSTNITNLEKIQDAKSKYLVTKDSISALNSMGMDAVSISSDHMVDFPEDIFKNTIDTLEKNEIFVAGRENTPVYLQKDDKKIAIISTNAVVNGTSKNYTKEGISIYEKENLIKNIKEAKDCANIVIVDVHWGREYTYGLNDQMRNIATTAIDFGADMVIGSHALGVYPIVKYKDKPIIYSTGYLISDTDFNVGLEGYIFNIGISKEGKIDNITMTPTYIVDKKKTCMYTQYDPIKAAVYLEQFNKWNIENSLDSKVQNGKIIVKL